MRPGTVLAGKYEVERVLGQGGMGLVVAARHLQLHERVAIKFLLPEATAIPEVVARFAREARAAVRIKSEHVARVSDVGTLEGGEPYMVMEYLEGADLAERLAREGALPLELAVEFLLQASEAIAEAHALGIVHRDLKPANLFVVRRADGILSVKVLDFGISKVTQAGASDVVLTQTAAVMGSPLYMPPEQMAASRDVDARADIWALGAILYELLAARAPFAGETLPEVCMRIATELPPPLATYRPDVPPALEAVILRCLEKDRERRYPNVAELAVALGGFAPARARVSVDRVLRTIQAAGLSSSAPSVPPSAAAFGLAPAVTAGTGTEAQWGRTTRGPGSKWGRVLAGSVAAVAVLGALAFVLARRTASPEAGPPAPKPGGEAAVAASPPPAADSPSATADRAASPVADLPSVVPLPSSVAPAVSAELTPTPKRSSTRRSLTSNKSAPSRTAATATSQATSQPARKSSVFDER